MADKPKINMKLLDEAVKKVLAYKPKKKGKPRVVQEGVR